MVNSVEIILFNSFDFLNPMLFSGISSDICFKVGYTEMIRSKTVNSELDL